MLLVSPWWGARFLVRPCCCYCVRGACRRAALGEKLSRGVVNALQGLEDQLANEIVLSRLHIVDLEVYHLGHRQSGQFHLTQFVVADDRHIGDAESPIIDCVAADDINKILGIEVPRTLERHPYRFTGLLGMRHHLVKERRRRKSLSGLWQDMDRRIRGRLILWREEGRPERERRLLRLKRIDRNVSVQREPKR